MLTASQLRPRSTRRGAALLTALAAVVVVAGMGVVFNGIQSAMLRRQAQAVDSKRALYVAEAGLSEAFFALSMGKSGNVGTPEKPAGFGNGVYWVEATWLEDDLVELESTGLCGRGRFCIGQVVKRPQNPIAALGVYGDAGLVVEAGSVIDGFDSREGRWSGAKPGQGLSLRSNGTIQLRGESSGPDPVTRVLGDVLVSPGEVLEMEPGVEVSGATIQAPVATAAPEVTVVELPAAGPLLVKESVAVLENTFAAYESIHVERDSELIVRGPCMLDVSELIVDPKGRLRIEALAGSVQLYVGSISMPAGSFLDSSAEPGRSACLVILEDSGSDSAREPSPLGFSPGGEFHGILYAPLAHLSLPASLRVFGSVGARTLSVEPGTSLTFDQATLASSAVVAGFPEQLSWKLLPLPDVPLVQQRLDPVMLLRLDGVEPTASYQAHLEQEIELAYLTPTGTMANYVGLPGDIDLSSMTVVLSLAWVDAPPGTGMTLASLPGLPGGQGPAAPGDPEQVEGGGVRADVTKALSMLSGGSLKSTLIDLSPLSNDELVAAFDQGKMSTGDFKAVCQSNLPLAEPVCFKVLEEPLRLSSGDTKNVLINSSPLSANTLAALADCTDLSSGDKASILAVQ